MSDKLPTPAIASRLEQESLCAKTKLFDNVQFIYELVLAQLELRSLGAAFEMTDSLGAAFEMTDEFSSFKLVSVEDEERLRRRLAHFETVNGASTDYFYISRKNRTRSVNQYLTVLLNQELLYTGC